MSNPASQTAKSVAEIEQDLEKARAIERDQARKADEAKQLQAQRRKQREDLAKELDTRLLQIAHQEKWLNERRADAKALEQRISTEFADLQKPHTQKPNTPA